MLTDHAASVTPGAAASERKQGVWPVSLMGNCSSGTMVSATVLVRVTSDVGMRYHLLPDDWRRLM